MLKAIKKLQTPTAGDSEVPIRILSIRPSQVCFTIAGLLPVLMSVVVPAARLFPSQVSRASSAFTAQSNLLLASAGAYFSRASMSDQPAKHEFLVTYVTVPNAAVAKTISQCVHQRSTNEDSVIYLYIFTQWIGERQTGGMR